MVDDEDFQALEQRVTALESQQGVDHRLALSLDRDVAALQAQRDADRRVLQALRDTQIEDHERILRLEQGQARLEQGQAATTVSLGMIIRMLERLQPED